MAFSGGFSTSYSESSAAGNQSANNQDFSNMFGKKNLTKNDYVKAAIVAAGFVGLYLILKKKKLV